MIKPNMINLSSRFIALTSSSSSQVETIVCNLVKMLKQKNPDAWESFSTQEYEDFCTHVVSYKELAIITFMENGGTPDRSIGYVEGGLLSQVNGQYSFTPKLLKALEKFQVKE